MNRPDSTIKNRALSRIGKGRAYKGLSNQSASWVWNLPSAKSQMASSLGGNFHQARDIERGKQNEITYFENVNA